jgi:SPP1 gp7 family putative phage head morphogenesis protein
LDRNKLTGPIPESFGSFKKPGPDIILSHNQLSGPIPASLGQIDPERIDLSRNKLEGDASVLFGNKKRTQILDLSRNLLSFDFSKVDFPKQSLIWLDVNHNKIYGKIPTALTEVENLQQFNVSYNRADMLVRTELAHIQTQAAQKRYEDYGIQEVEIWADEDERRCDVCGNLHEKRYPMGAAVPIPAHPNCRCCIVPVVEIE